MEYIVFFGAVGVFFIGVFIRELFSAKKREKKFAKSLYEDYGKLKKKNYSMERFVRIASYYEKHKREGQLDDITWNDLNMDEIFKEMDHTLSATGEEYLYYILRNTLQSGEELAHLEEVICFFMEHPDQRVKLQLQTSDLGYTGKYSIYDYLDNLNFLGTRSNTRQVVLNLLFIPLIIILPFSLQVGLIGLSILCIYNIVSYFKEKELIDPYITSIAYVRRLMRACENMMKVKVPVCETEWQTLRENYKILSELKKGSYLVFSAKQSTGSGNPIDIIMDYVRMVFHVDIIMFNKMLKHLRLHIENVDRLIEVVGYIEACISIGAFRVSRAALADTASAASLGYCIPEFTGENTFSITEAYHPLLKNPVKNSITTENGVLLTGSNASGKSTFLKTIAINACLAQTIHTCMADSYQAPFFRIFSSMALRDDLGSGESYYIVEIKALKRILDEAARYDGRVLCFVDEVLRGTNTVERIAASTQILKSLAGNNILCFAATHDIEMTELLCTYYDNYHFEEEIKEGDIFFNYKLFQGKATTRNAIKLLEIMGYDEHIIAQAARQAEVFVESGSWQLQ